MKKPLEEVLREATAGPFSVFEVHNNNRIVVNGAGNHAIRFLEGTFVSNSQPEIKPSERDANAALFAHAVNVLPELVEALKDMERHTSSYSESSLSFGVLNSKIKALLDKATQVEIPE